MNDTMSDTTLQSWADALMAKIPEIDEGDFGIPNGNPGEFLWVSRQDNQIVVVTLRPARLEIGGDHADH